MRDLNTVFSALADPTRRAVLAKLASGEASVMELAASHKMSQPSFSRHIHVLEEAGLILRRVEGTRRPCRLAPDGLAALEQWMALMRRALEANYGRLDGVLAAMSMEAKGNDNDQDDT